MSEVAPRASGPSGPAVAGWTLLVALALVAPLVVAARAGALDIPRSDDWSYLLTLFRFADNGQLRFNNWVSMTLVGQLALAAPVALVFHRSITAVHVATAFLGFGGLVALVQGTERPHRRGAMLLAITIAAGPMWSPLASTFMTDVPAFAVQCIFLALVFRAFRAPELSVPAYAVAMTVGFIAIAIRQYEAVPVLATAIVVLVVARHRRAPVTRALVLVTAAVGLGTLILYAWWSSLPDSLSLAPAPAAAGAVANLTVRLGGFVRLVGLLLVPVVVAAGPVGIVRRAWRASAAITAAVAGAVSLWLVASYLRVPDIPFVGNYLDRWGVLSRDVLRGARGDVIPAPVFTLLAVAGSLGAIVLALAAVPAVVDLARRAVRRDLVPHDPITAILGLSVLGFAAAYSIAIVAHLPVFDRYALPTLPLVGLLLVRRRVTEAGDAAATDRSGGGVSARATSGAVVATVIALGLVGLVYATDSASYDAARWRVDQQVVRKGWSPLQIDGGFEWIAWYRKVGPPAPAGTQAERIRRRVAYLAPFCIDVIVNPGPKARRHEIARATVHGLGHADETIVAVPNGKPCPRVRRPSPG